MLKLQSKGFDMEINFPIYRDADIGMGQAPFLETNLVPNVLYFILRKFRLKMKMWPLTRRSWLEV